MNLRIEDLATMFLPDRYQLRLNEMDDLWDCAQHDLWSALSAAYNYGFIRGQRAEKNSRRKSRSGRSANR